MTGIVSILILLNEIKKVHISCIIESVFAGSVTNGYQQSHANFSIGSGGNVSSMGSQRITSQMIPTPGFNSNSNQSYMEPSSNGSAVSSVDSTMVSQTQHQKQHIGGQNSRILHNLGTQMSGFQQKSYGFSNGALNGGAGLTGNRLAIANEHGVSDSYMTSTAYIDAPKPLQQHFDQQLRPTIQSNLVILLSHTL